MNRPGRDSSSHLSVEIPLEDQPSHDKPLGGVSPKALQGLLVDVAPLGTALAGGERKGWTSLHHAARYGKTEAIKYLIHTADVLNKQTETEGMTALHLAVKGQHTDCVDMLLSHGADTTILDQRGKTALHLAARTSTEMVQVFLAYQGTIDVDQPDDDQMTPLMDSVLAGNISTCKLLIDAGAKVLTRDVGDQNCLMLAATCAKTEIVKLILNQAKIALNAEKTLQLDSLLISRDNEGNTALHHACMHNQVSNAKLLLEAGASVNASKMGGQTCLHLACIYGFSDIVNILLEYGADVNSRDSDMSTPLHCAALANQINCLKLLITKSGDMAAKDALGKTALHCAAWKGHAEVLRCLVSAGCDVFAIDNKMRAALHWTTLGVHVDCTVALFSQLSQGEFNRLLTTQDENDQTCLHLASAAGEVDVVTQLLEYGADPLVQDEDDRTPLHLAALAGQVGCVEKLIGRSKFEMNDKDSDGRSPMLLACVGGHYDTVNIFLRCGGDVAVRSRDELLYTSLILAASNGHTDIVKLLLDNGADINAFNKHKNTALHLACKNDHSTTIDLLLSRQADLTARNIELKTPLDLAIDNHSISAASQIIQSHRWREAMDCVDANQKTAFPALVAYMPSVAQLILDQCVVRTGDPQGPDYKVDYDFHYINPPPGQKCCDTNVWYLNDMAEHNCEGLLKHELVNKNIMYKWRTGAQLMHTVGFIYYLAMLGCIIAYILITPIQSGAFIDDDGCLTTPANITIENYSLRNQEAIRYLLENSDTDPVTGELFVKPTVASEVFFRLIVFYFGVYCFQLVFGLAINRAWFLMKLETYTNGLTAIFLVFWLWSSLKHGVPCLRDWRYGWLAVVMSWFNVLSYLIRIPGQAPLYVVMFGKVLLSVLKVLTLFIMFYMALATCFYITIDSKEFRTFPVSLVTTFNMGLGEINYADIVLDIPDKVFFVDNLILIVLFLILIPISLMNLLIGLAIGDIEAIRSKAEILLIKMRITSINETEAYMVQALRRKLYKSSLTVWPNRQNVCYSKFLSLFRRCATRSNYHRNRGWKLVVREERERPSADSMETTISNLGQELSELKKQFNQQSELLIAVATKMGVHADKIDS